MNTSIKLSTVQQDELLKTLQVRFEKYKSRHGDIKWENVCEKLKSNLTSLFSLYQMEQTGGEPDVVLYSKKTGEYVFFDCSPESPSGRRSLCYDRKALEARKEHKPKNSAVDLAKEIGIELLTEEQYRFLQTLGEFDTKTSSWIKTPEAIRKHGGAVFCDRRYDHVFLYHNGADSYYAARGFRGMLNV